MGTTFSYYYPDFLYRGPAWVARITRQELRKPRSPAYTGVRISSHGAGISTVYTRVYSRLRGRACAWEIEGLRKVSLLLPVTDADAAYLHAWYKTHGCAWPRAKGGVHPCSRISCGSMTSGCTMSGSTRYRSRFRSSVRCRSGSGMS